MVIHFLAVHSELDATLLDEKCRYPHQENKVFWLSSEYGGLLCSLWKHSTIPDRHFWLRQLRPLAQCDDTHTPIEERIITELRWIRPSHWKMASFLVRGDITHCFKYEPEIREDSSYRVSTSATLVLELPQAGNEWCVIWVAGRDAFEK